MNLVEHFFLGKELNLVHDKPKPIQIEVYGITEEVKCGRPSVLLQRVSCNVSSAHVCGVVRTNEKKPMIN